MRTLVSLVHHPLPGGTEIGTAIPDDWDVGDPLPEGGPDFAALAAAPDPDYPDAAPKIGFTGTNSP